MQQDWICNDYSSLVATPSLHPRNQAKIEAVRRKSTEKAYLTKRHQEAEHDYVRELEGERANQDHEVAELRRTINEL